MSKYRQELSDEKTESTQTIVPGCVGKRPAPASVEFGPKSISIVRGMVAFLLRSAIALVSFGAYIQRYVVA